MNIFRVTLAIFLMMVTLLQSRPSQAAVGAVVAAPAVVTAGLAVAGTGLGLGVVGAMSIGGGDGGMIAGAFLMAVLVPIIGVGLLILEGEQSVTFDLLPAEAAKKLGVTEKERKAYNSEIDQLNALASFVDQEMALDNTPTKEEAANVWLDVKEAVSPEAFKVLVKVNAQLFKK